MTNEIAEAAILEAAELASQLRAAVGFLRGAGLHSTAGALLSRANRASHRLSVLRMQLGAEEHITLHVKTEPEP